MKLCDEKMPHFDPLKKISQRKGPEIKFLLLSFHAYI